MDKIGTPYIRPPFLPTFRPTILPPIPPNQFDDLMDKIQKLILRSDLWDMVMNRK